MSRAVLEYGDSQVHIDSLEDGVITIQVFTDKGERKPQAQEIVVDTKYNAILTGNMCNILVHILKGRRNKNE